MLSALFKFLHQTRGEASASVGKIKRFNDLAAAIADAFHGDRHLLDMPHGLHLTSALRRQADFKMPRCRCNL